MSRRVLGGLALALAIVAFGATAASACSWRRGGCGPYGYYAPRVYGYYAPPPAYYAPPPVYSYYAAPRAYYAPPPAYMYYGPTAYGYASYGYYYRPRIYRGRFSPL
jgi:hypothetical protein